MRGRGGVTVDSHLEERVEAEKSRVEKWVALTYVAPDLDVSTFAALVLQSTSLCADDLRSLE